MIKNKIKGGFTLIELLVVITIIGILATGAVTVYTSQIQKARDTTRITDAKSLQSGIEQFYQDTAMYPQGGKDWLANSGSTNVQNYAPSLARDPKDYQTCNGATCGYAYLVSADSNGILQGAYELSLAFEDSGNKNNKAGNDRGDDNARLEFSVGSSTLNTSKSTGSWGTAALATTDTTAKIHIGGTSTAPTSTNTVTGF